MKTPTVLIILGATGDLVRRKIAPSLYNLYAQGSLPKKLQVVAFARREFSDQDYREYLKSNLESHPTNPKTLAEFLNIFVYHQGFLDQEEGFTQLAARLGYQDGNWKSCANRLFYLAVPPELYENIFRFITSSGLASPCSELNWLASRSSKSEGWSRVVVEKPFGKNLKTAEKLDSTLGELFHEDQIYRIDHYLAKEMLQNIIAFRFMNDMFESSWNAGSIEKIELRLLEKLGVEHRGAFYDGVGALRDMGQNHLCLMLALIAMDRPASLLAPDIREKRASILEKLVTPTAESVKLNTFRAQYAGYRQIENVDPHSTTETYFKLRAHLDSPRWKNVAIYMESGKRMGESFKDITVTFKHPSSCLCSKPDHHRNKIIFTMEPNEAIFVHFWAKKPGHSFEMEERTLEFSLRDSSAKGQYVEEYQKLLLDAINGDQTLFTSTAEVKAMWRFIDPIVFAWDKNTVPLHHYQPDEKETLLIADDYLAKGSSK